MPIIAALAHASFAAITNARHLVRTLHELRETWSGTVRARRGAATWRLADRLLRQPVVDTATVARDFRIAPGNAWRPIAPLVEAGILTEFTGFTRNRLWQAQEVLDALDGFADRAGRRVPG